MPGIEPYVRLGLARLAEAGGIERRKDKSLRESLGLAVGMEERRSLAEVPHIPAEELREAGDVSGFQDGSATKRTSRTDELHQLPQTKANRRTAI